MTSASSYYPRYQSRSSMYIRGLIPRNVAELAEAVPIGTMTRQNQQIECAQREDSCQLGHQPSLHWVLGMLVMTKCFCIRKLTTLIRLSSCLCWSELSRYVQPIFFYVVIYILRDCKSRNWNKLNNGWQESNVFIRVLGSGQTFKTISNGPRREKTCLRRCANNTGADQPAHPRSLISAFVIRLLESIISRLNTDEISIF